MRRLQSLPFLPDFLTIHLLVLLLLPCHGCKDDGPVPPVTSLLRLSAEDASCTEAWLRVQLDASAQPRTVLLKRDTVIVFNRTVVSSDTMIIDEGLLPRRSYAYQAFRLSNGAAVEQTPTVQLTAMDTTTNNFTWQMDTLGATASVLYDVAIINDTLAYAVGEMYLKDSTGQIDPLLYNFARWNGYRWEIKRVSYVFRGNVVTVPLYGIGAFSPTDIWLASGDVVHGDGVTWVGFDVRAITGYDTLSFKKCWGRTSSDMYFVGYRGSFAHYNGNAWQRIESGTTLHFYDILAVQNQGTNDYEVFAVAGRLFQGPEHGIFRIDGNTVQEISSNAIPSTLYSVWFKPGRIYLVVGDGLFRKYSVTSSAPWTDLAATSYFLYSIRGQSVNDIVACGAFGEMLHYNGLTWRSYRAQTGLVNGVYTSVASKGDMVIAIGFESSRAVILKGTRMR